MATTVRELKEFLEQFPDDVEVRYAAQPRWAFEYSIELHEHDPVAVRKNDYSDEKVQAVYLAEGRQLAYLPSAASVAIGWTDAEENDS
jgi:hypothetical protein